MSSPPVPQRRSRLAFVSPLPPQRSGVAAYAAELIPALAAHYDLDLVCEDATAREAWSHTGHKVLDPAAFSSRSASYDRILYQLGNSNAHRWMFPLLQDHPGVVTLHDVFLSGVLSDMDTSSFREGAWFEALYRDHGWGPAADRYLHRDPFAVIQRYPCCGAALFDSVGAIVHSREALERIRRWYGGWADTVSLIPHLRAPYPPCGRGGPAAGGGIDLGFAPDDFVVCSFGGLGPSKLNHRLLAAFAASASSGDPRCRLAFVGGELSSDYAQELQRQIEALGLGERVRLTGWVEPDTYNSYLRRADLAVQLRAHSRGESSGAALDCLNHGAPVLVNAHGSMGELPADAVWRLPDAFTDAQLAGALERLRADAGLRARLAEAGRRRIRAEHAPAA
ncbi:glycosyltransferase family 4 protein, partial [Alsobacter soli]|uniref:glycosyltransferase family 4 protein n=1 Tax=Alsobacter soli TaxID=2109933 RepID=UPI0011B21C30